MHVWPTHWVWLAISHRFIIRTSHLCQGLRRCRLSCYPLLPHHLLQPRHPVKILWCHALTICLFRVTANNPSVWFLHVLVHISGGLFQGIGIARSSENLTWLCCISVCRVFPRMHLAVVDIPCSDRRCWSQWLKGSLPQKSILLWLVPWSFQDGNILTFTVQTQDSTGRSGGTP